MNIITKMLGSNSFEIYMVSDAAPCLRLDSKKLAALYFGAKW